jgi:nucleotide-binding universal stress UspA family protein
MLAINRILHPTDFSDSASKALAYALDLAARTGAALHLLHVVHGRDTYAGQTHLGAQADENLLIRLRELVNAQLGALPSEARGSLDLAYELAEGRHAAPAILEHATRRDVDLLAMGTHGRRGLRHLFLGSVAEEVLRRASCPALVVRHREATAQIKHIVVPLDFSEHSSAALAQAKHLAALYRATLTLLFVAEEHLVPFFSDTGIPTFSLIQIDPDIVAKAAEALRQLDARTGGPEVSTTYEVRIGQAPIEVIDYARAGGADLIVMATRGLTGVERGLLGSVTERVVRTAPCPVWTINPSADASLTDADKASSDDEDVS